MFQHYNSRKHFQFRVGTMTKEELESAFQILSGNNFHVTTRVGLINKIVYLLLKDYLQRRLHDISR